MPNSDPAKLTIQQATTESTTLRSAVTSRIKQIFLLQGMEKAIGELNQMAEFFSGCYDWPDINNEVMAFLLEMKQLSDRSEAERLEKRDSALLKAIAGNGLNGQVNLMLGQSPQAPYYAAPTNGTEKH